MLLTLKPDQVPDVVDALLSECCSEDRSVPRLIALIREKTRRDRSDADLEAQCGISHCVGRGPLPKRGERQFVECIQQ
jgi:hypothetical protein